VANATIIYACTAEGLAILNKPGTLNEWLPPRRVLEGRPVLSVWGDPGPPIRVVAAVNADPYGGEGAGGELLLSESGGRTWERKLAGPVISVLGVESEEGLVRLYAGMEEGGIAGSIDGGVTWGVLPGLERGGRVRLVGADIKDRARLYVLLEDGEGTALLHGSPEEGEWRTLATFSASAIAQDTATGDLYASTPGEVEMSADMGSTWAPLPGSPSGGSPIAVIPGPQDSPPSLVMGASPGLFVSPDGGITWSPVELPAPGAVTALARDPERRDRLYAATSSGYIFESGNRGLAWQQVNVEPLPEASYLYVVRI
jgi:photosystem II stability/assembly factor-like uncharacterized protein